MHLNSINLLDFGKLTIKPIYSGEYGWLVRYFKVLEFETPQIFVEIFDIIYSIDEIIFWIFRF